MKWEDLKGRVDIVQVLTSLLGPPPGRRGAKPGQYWWPCMYHDDKHPSFHVDREKGLGYCFGCGKGGDVITLAMHIRNEDFRSTVQYLAGDYSGPVAVSARVKTPSRKAAPVADPDALTQAEALEIVETSERRLWTAEGAEALAYLRGRGFTDATIRRFRLGWTPRLNRVAWSPQGVVVPWLNGDDLVLVKIRCDQSFIERFTEHKQPPRYLEVYRSPSASDRDDPPCFPGLGTIEPGLPLVITEGEADTMLLAQELDGLASVLTLGGASNRPGPSTLAGIMSAWPVYAGQDADDAGDKAAAAWPASVRRVRPPVTKDWGDVRKHGVDIRRWWGDVFNGIERPPLFTWDELSKVGGGGGIVVDRPPSRAELIATLTAAFDGTDPHEALEREAIRWADGIGQNDTHFRD